MLSLEDVITLYHEELEVRFRRKPDPLGLKGDYDDEPRAINIYLAHSEGPEDIDITILHEFYHAKDYIIRELDHSPERLAEKEAKRTYYNRPEVLALIKELWGIRR